MVSHGQKWSDVEDSSMKRELLLLGTKVILLYCRTAAWFGDSFESPRFFVKEIRPEKNEVVLASLQALEKTKMFLKDWNIVSRERLLGHTDVIVKIRYRKQENHCTVTVTSDNLLYVQLHEPLTAIAPGQAAAFYKDGLLLGGGIIME